jgi:RNA polymerase sigma factor (sigma-70 family)
MTTDPPDDLSQTRLSLVARLKDSDDKEAWQRFLTTYGPLLQRVARRAGLTETEAEDAVQETVISVVRTMPGFKYDPSLCSFKTWLQHLAHKRIADQFRKRSRATGPAHDSTTSGTPVMERVADPRSIDPDAAWEAEWRKTLFDAAVRRVKNQVGVEQFQIFDFYVLKNWPVKRVASTLGVSSARVYIAKHRVMRVVKREVQRLEKEGL